MYWDVISLSCGKFSLVDYEYNQVISFVNRVIKKCSNQTISGEAYYSNRLKKYILTKLFSVYCKRCVCIFFFKYGKLEYRRVCLSNLVDFT